MKRLDRLLSISYALAAGAMLVILYPVGQTPPPVAPVPATLAWPNSPIFTLSTSLPDGTTYQPDFFLAADTSIGTAPSPDHRSLRLILVEPAHPIRLLRSRAGKNLWFGSFTASGDVLAWAESNGQDHQLWTVNLHDGRPARLLTADTGHAVLSATPHDLVIAGGRLHWIATQADQPSVTEIRSVALNGGPVDIRPEPGTWALSTWPWLVNGNSDAAGTTTMRDMLANRDVPVSVRGDRQTTQCDPTWCQVVSISPDGYQIETVHPDGTGRRIVATGQVGPAIDDTVPLDRYVVLSEVSAYNDFTNTRQLLVYDLNTMRMIEITAAARTVSYSDGVLWWSTGTQDAPIWHAVELPTA